MKHLMKSVFHIFICMMILVFIAYGIICIFSEVTPWTPASQFLQFIKGIGILAICMVVVAVTDKIGGNER